MLLKMEHPAHRGGFHVVHRRDARLHRKPALAVSSRVHMHVNSRRQLRELSPFSPFSLPQGSVSRVTPCYTRPPSSNPQTRVRFRSCTQHSGSPGIHVGNVSPCSRSINLTSCMGRLHHARGYGLNDSCSVGAAPNRCIANAIHRRS